MIKTTDENRLGDVIQSVVSMINHVNTRPVKSRVFKTPDQEMDTDHRVLLFHSKIRRFSK